MRTAANEAAHSTTYTQIAVRWAKCSVVTAAKAFAAATAFTYSPLRAVRFSAIARSSNGGFSATGRRFITYNYHVAAFRAVETDVATFVAVRRCATANDFVVYNAISGVRRVTVTRVAFRCGCATCFSSSARQAPYRITTDWRAFRTTIFTAAPVFDYTSTNRVVGYYTFTTYRVMRGCNDGLTTYSS